MAKKMPQPTTDQVRKLLTTATNKALEGLLSTAKAVAKTGAMTEDEAKAVVNEAIDAFAASH